MLQRGGGGIGSNAPRRRGTTNKNCLCFALNSRVSLQDFTLCFGLNFVVMWIDYTGHSLFLLKPRAYRTLRNFSLSLSLSLTSISRKRCELNMNPLLCQSGSIHVQSSRERDIWKRERIDSRLSTNFDGTNMSDWLIMERGGKKCHTRTSNGAGVSVLRSSKTLFYASPWGLRANYPPHKNISADMRNRMIGIVPRFGSREIFCSVSWLQQRSNPFSHCFSAARKKSSNDTHAFENKDGNKARGVM